MKFPTTPRMKQTTIAAALFLLLAGTAQAQSIDAATTDASGNPSTIVTAQALGPNATAVGNGAYANQGNYFIGGATAVGSNAEAFADLATAIGTHSVAIQYGATAIGYNAYSNGQGAVAMGYDSSAGVFDDANGATDAIAIGAHSYAQTDHSIAIGDHSNASGLGSVAIGSSSGYDANGNPVAATIASGVNSVAIGQGSIATANNVFSVGAVGNERVIQNVAPGRVSATSTDAVNGSQLYGVQSNLQNQVDSLATGQAATNAATAANAAANSVANGNVNSVGTAVTANASAITANAAAISQTNVSLVNTSAAVSANTAAINQTNANLATTNANVAANTAAIDQFRTNLNQTNANINSTARAAYSGVAAATALTMIPGVDPGKTISVGIGGGSYHGYNAVALGAEARVSESVKVRFGVSESPDGTAFGTGASFQF